MLAIRDEPWRGQLSEWSRLNAAPVELPSGPVVEPPTLRPYQEACVRAVLGGLHRGSALVEMPTGTGKSVALAECARRYRGRVLVLVHRTEIMVQLAATLEWVTGEPIGTERGDSRYGGERIAVSTVQTALRRNLASPGLLIVDECHVTGSSWGAVVERWPGAAVVGFSATGARADKRGLPLERLAYRMTLAEAVNGGWLVPLRGERPVLDNVRLSDPEGAEPEVLEPVAGIADVVAQRYGLYRGILFWPNRGAAQACTRLLNERLGGCVYMDGLTPRSERDRIRRALDDGTASWLCNVDVASEGFDWPACDIVGICHCIKSKPAYIQRVGRVTRPYGVDLNDFRTPEERRLAIAQSVKPHGLLVDFAGINLGLATDEALLGASVVAPEEAARPEPEEDIPEPSGFAPRLPRVSVRSSTSFHVEPFNPLGA